MLLKIFSTLFGYNYEVVKGQSTVSKQKIITLGTLMLIPVSLWTISGFYIGYNLLVSRINKVVNKMETTAMEFIDILEEPTK